MTVTPDRVLQHVVRYGERVFQRVHILHHEAARLVRLEEPLVGVEPDRAGAARSSVRANRDGIESGGPVPCHSVGECLHVQPETPVARDQAHMLPLDPHDPGCANLGTVTLVTHVDGRLAAAPSGLPGRHESCDRGNRSATCKESACSLRIADPLPYPVDDNQLELAGAARGEPCALVDLVVGDLIRQLQHLFTVHLQTGTVVRTSGGARLGAPASDNGSLRRMPAHPGTLSATSLPGRPTCTTMCCCPS